MRSAPTGPVPGRAGGTHAGWGPRAGEEARISLARRPTLTEIAG